jgi:hypothetical protein
MRYASRQTNVEITYRNNKILYPIKNKANKNVDKIKNPKGFKMESVDA